MILFKKRLLLFISIMLLISISCAYFSEKLDKPERSVNKEYNKMLKKWTRETKVYKDLETRLIANATLKTKEFRELYVKKYSLYYLFNQQREWDMLNQELGVEEKINEFFFEAYTPNEDWNDFGDYESRWRIYLIDDKGNQINPGKIDRVYDEFAFLKEFYPYIKKWSKFYLIKFHKNLPNTNLPFINEDTKSITLVITSAMGKSEMIWEF